VVDSQRHVRSVNQYDKGDRIMTNSFAKFHDEIKLLMARHKGKEYRFTKLREIFQAEYPNLNADWFLPSDHCINHKCKGSCDCSMTDRALFERVGYGKYVVL